MRQISNPELKIVASAELMERGCVYVISLAPIQAEIGARWDRTCEAVWSHLDNLLRQSLAPTDFFSRLDDTACLISMPSATPTAAQICCLRIAHELHSVMLGPCELENLAIERAVPLPGGIVGTIPFDVSQLDQAALRAAIALPHGADIVDKPVQRGQPAPEVKFIHRFLPIWDAQKNAITTYRCQTVPDAEMSERLGSLTQFKLDLCCALACIRNAAGILSERLAAGERFLVWIPVSYEMLSAPTSRIEISALCRSLSAELRPYLIFEICDLPHGVPQSRMSELAGALRPFCRSVMAQLPPRSASYSAYQGAGLHAIGLSFAAGTGAEMLSEIFKLGIAAQRQHMLSFVLDIPTEEALRSAHQRGVTLLSGPLIGGAMEQPGPVRRLTIDAICRQAACQAAA